MEIVTLEYVIKYGEKKECVVLYFRDKESAEEYKDNLEGDPNITFEDDAIGYQYYNAGEWYSEINDMIVDQAWGKIESSRRAWRRARGGTYRGASCRTEFLSCDTMTTSMRIRVRYYALKMN